MGAISLGASHLLYFTKAQSKGFLTLHTTTAAAPSQKGRRRRLQTIRCEYSDGKFREQGPPFHRSFDSVESGDFYFTSSKDTARSERDGRTTDLNAVQCPDRSTSAKKSDSRWRAWMGDQTGEETKNPILRLFRAATCAILAAGVVVFQSSDPSAWAEEVKVTFPGSKISEVMTVQRTMVEAWGIVRETFVDTSFNNQNWDLLLQKSLTETLAITSPEDVYSKIKTMLSSLGDPFTRIITPKEYESFRINSDGALEGVGLLIASERETGRLIVMSPIEGGPAARAGIISGDELVQIDDQVLTGLNGDDVATKLRGRAGTSVTLILRRPVTNPGMPNGEPLEFKLRRETVTLNPVFSAVLPHPLPNGQLVKTGYIRLAAFSQNAAREMARTISSLEAEGVDSYILDLRNNPGGLVKAGLDVAQMWLNGTGVLVNTIDRDGYTQPVTLVNGHSLTSDPLVVLVNESSASASEILAGALHDNGRALLVGEKTFGKGKIQSVTELTDGSALFVTVAKYLSPRFHEIDRVGIAPDLKCNLEIIPGLKDPAPTPPPEEQLVLDPRTKVDQRSITNLQRDSCIRVAEYELDISS